MDAVTNFAYSLIHTAPSPASSGLSLKVESGDGVLFPTGHFNATIWPAGTRPLHTNAEIVRVTAIAGDEFTIERVQEGSSAREIKVGDQIMAGVTSKMIKDIETSIAEVVATSIPRNDEILANIKWLGAVGDNSHLNTEAIQKAIDEVHSASVGGNVGGVVFFPKGKFVTGKLTLRDGVTLHGAGTNVTVLKLAAGTNDNLIETENFQEIVKGEGLSFGPRNFGVEYMTLDGAKSENPISKANANRCLAIEGVNFRIEDVEFKNALKAGLWTGSKHEDASTKEVDGSYESFICNIKCYHNGGAGFVFTGPTSTYIHNVMCYNNDSESAGVLVENSAFWSNCRSWGFQKYAWLISAPGRFINIVGEEGRTANVFFNGESSNCQFTNFFVYNQGEAPSSGLVVIGEAGKEPTGITIENLRTLYNGAGTTPSLNIEHMGEHCRITGRIQHEVAQAALVGEPKGDSNVDLTIHGATPTVSYSSERKRAEEAEQRFKATSLLRENFSRLSTPLEGQGTLASGRLTLASIWLPSGLTIKNLVFATGNAAEGQTHWWFALYDESRKLLATAADQLTAAWAASTVKSLPIAQIASGASSTFTTTYSGLHYMGIMVVASTKVPTIAGHLSVSAVAGLAPVLFGPSTEGLTAAPTFPSTAGAITGGSNFPWCAVS